MKSIGLKKLKNPLYLISVLALLGLVGQAFATTVRKPINQATLDWMNKPGVKAIIYTESDPDKFITIDSDNGLLRFKSCECNQPPDCPDLLAPFFAFTPQELLSAGKKQKSLLNSLEMIAGAILIAAPSIPGVPANPAALIGALPTIGNAINPAAVFQQTLKNESLAKGIAKTVQDGAAKGAPPIAVMKTGGDFSQVQSSFRNFLINLKNQQKDQKDQLTKQEKQYYEDIATGKAKPAESCDAQIKDEVDQILTQLKSDQPLSDKQESLIKPSKAAQLQAAPLPASQAAPATEKENSDDVDISSEEL